MSEEHFSLAREYRLTRQPFMDVEERKEKSMVVVRGKIKRPFWPILHFRLHFGSWPILIWLIRLFGPICIDIYLKISF